MMKAIRIHISGKVQGVGFRQSTLQKANALCIYGSVKNLSDGSVEIIAQGKHKNLEALKEWSHIGPIHAQVSLVEIIEIQLPKAFTSFEILR